MKRIWRYNLYLLACITLFLGCPFEYPPSYHFVEIRTVLYKTNIIGITGPAAIQGEEYIEISYSAANDTRPGYNKTESIMISPPYIFQNNRVYIQYDFYERRRADGKVIGYEECLLHDYGEGGAEYLQIINHSSDKAVEYFFAGGQDMPDTIEKYTNARIDTFSNTVSLPAVRYKKAPIQYLLFPDRKPNYDLTFFLIPYTFKGNSCGGITIIEPWMVNDVNELYRAEYNHSNEIKLSISFDDSPSGEKRMIDLIEGKGVSDYEKSFAGKVFWGAIEPGKSLEGSDKIWLLATPFMFQDEISYENR